MTYWSLQIEIHNDSRAFSAEKQNKTCKSKILLNCDLKLQSQKQIMDLENWDTPSDEGLEPKKSGLGQP